MDKVDIISVVIAAVSAVIAGVSLFVAVKFARRQTQLQEKVTAIEEGRWRDEVEAKRHARVTVDLEPRHRLPHLPEPQFVVTNHGPAPADKVAFTVATLDGTDVPHVEGIEALPLATLQPGQRMAFPVYVVLTKSETLQVTATWTDDAGEHEVPFTLRVPW